jgi:hypothetical protein
MPKYVLIHGNPIDGLNIVGPFSTSNDAHFEGEGINDEYWITELEEPTNA